MEIVSLAERPDLIPAMWQLLNDWPAFMMNDPHGDIFYPLLSEVFPQWQLVALDDGRVVGKVHAVPFGWDGTDEDLPDRGWDEVLERAFTDARGATPPTAVSLLEARLAPDVLGRARPSTPPGTCWCRSPATRCTCRSSRRHRLRRAQRLGAHDLRRR